RSRITGVSPVLRALISSGSHSPRNDPNQRHGRHARDTVESAGVIADSRGVETPATEHQEDRTTEVTSPGDLSDSLRMRVFCVLVLTVVACAAVFHGWQRGYVLAPTDALRLVAPWAKDPDYVARNEQL